MGLFVEPIVLGATAVRSGNKTFRFSRIYQALAVLALDLLPHRPGTCPLPQSRKLWGTDSDTWSFV